MECKFHVGQKVTCIDGEPVNWHKGFQGVVEGEVYTIRDIFIASDGNPRVRLLEIRNEPGLCRDGKVREGGFVPGRFRPIVTRNTDISIFTAMLNPSKVPA